MLPSSGIHVIPLPLGLSRWRNGVFLFHEKLSVPQVICVMLIVVGIAGLKILAEGAIAYKDVKIVLRRWKREFIYNGIL